MRASPLPLVLFAWALALPVAGGCVAPSHHPEHEDGIADPGPDDLYRDFLDGKFDGAGHPVGATVLEAGDGCSPGTGDSTKDGDWSMSPDVHLPGLACEGRTPRLGRGLYTVNLRAALEARKGCESDCEAADALHARVLDEAGELIAEQSFDASRFETDLAWQNLALGFTVRSPGAVQVEVEWPGQLPVRLDYVEIFRQDRQLVLSPASGFVEPGASFRIEIVDPEDDAPPSVTCNGEDVSARLVELLAAGEATEERTEFRRILTAPADALFEGCGPDRAVLVQSGSSRRGTTSEVRHLSMGPECDFTPGRVRVLLTGFVPFPAGSRSVNSSSLAVESFDPESVPDAAVMRLFLPVEFEAAAAIVREAMERCRPDVVVGFGQGRWAVDLETTAYNRRDTSEVAGGVPDNRGIIFDGAPIAEGAPDTLSSRLPIETIEARLLAEDVDVRPSDDPGLYVCNDLFFSTLAATDARTMAGFVHLPRIFSPTEDDVRMLKTVVREVVTASIEASPSGA